MVVAYTIKTDLVCNKDMENDRRVCGVCVWGGGGGWGVGVHMKLTINRELNKYDECRQEGRVTAMITRSQRPGLSVTGPVAHAKPDL